MLHYLFKTEFSVFKNLEYNIFLKSDLIMA